MRLAVLAAAAWALIGCVFADVDCTTESVPAVSVTVTNAATSEPICDAKVVIRIQDSNFTEEATPGPDCIYTGAHEQIGTFAVTVSADGFITDAVDNVIVLKDVFQCHPLTAPVAIALTPAP